MFKVKDEEQAALHLYRIYDLHLVAHCRLRPPRATSKVDTFGRRVLTDTTDVP
jgi:predicted GNAT family N-acyltransferase